jgi:CheY-like chemotaxis protein
MRCKSILVVEDNDNIRETLEEILTCEGYAVHTAKDGKKALETLKTLPSPSLILLDLMMPVMSGWEFLDAQKARAEFAAHQVVTISAVSATQSLDDPTPLETAGSMQKPLTLNRILDTVQHFCGPGIEVSEEAVAS